ncbi:50S ribosomal protein L34 [Phlyctema vagabunda]|uniref:50S ribosomal protein L34 n=1 Tax=Phlyctema vagabunda TaxID=108571 RepID=A0ABR4PY56_9HELO
MLCLRCSRGLNALPKSLLTPRTLQKASFQASAKRTFTSITPLRPTLSPSAFKPAFSNAEPIAESAAPLDLMPKLSTHPALGATQIRCGPRDTFSPSHFVRKRRHGFLSRLRTRKGRNTLARRRAKKRSTLSH